ncbi:MAG: DUF6427 family protein [Bacteroidales bacterium]
MLLKFFKRPLPRVFLAIVLLAILSWLKSFISGEHLRFYFDDTPMPLYGLVTQLLGESILVQRLVAFSVLMLCAILLIQINTKHILIKYRTYLPPLFFVLLSSSFLPLQRLTPALFAAVFLIISIDYILSAYSSKKPLDNFFKASFFIAVASLFYFAASFYILLVFISLIILRPPSIRDWLVSILGFITPWLFLVFYHYFFNDDIAYLANLLDMVSEPIGISRFYGVLFTIFYSFSGLLLIITLLFLIGSLTTQKISIRKYYSIFIWFLVISAGVAFLSPFSSIEITYLAAIPSAFIFSNFFTFSSSRLWTEILFSILIIIAVLMQFY